MDDAWPKFSLKEIENDTKSPTKYFILLNHNIANEKLKLTLLNGHKSYKCELSQNEMKDMATNCRIPLQEFTRITVTALTWEQLTKETFVYGMSEMEDTLQLTWKKVVPEEEIRIKLGSLNFKAVENSNEICNSFQQLCEFMSVKNQEIHKLRTERQELLATNKRQKDILEQEIQSKEEIEKELYSKFVLVLNKKKEKCKQYKQELANQKRSSNVAAISDESDVEETAQTVPKKSDNSLVFEDSDDDPLPTQTQRVVITKKIKSDDSKVVSQPSRANKNNKQSKKKRDIYEAGTQELMDDL